MRAKVVRELFDKATKSLDVFVFELLQINAELEASNSRLRVEAMMTSEYRDWRLNEEKMIWETERKDLSVYAYIDRDEHREWHWRVFRNGEVLEPYHDHVGGGLIATSAMDEASRAINRLVRGSNGENEDVTGVREWFKFMKDWHFNEEKRIWETERKDLSIYAYLEMCSDLKWSWRVLYKGVIAEPNSDYMGCCSNHDRAMFAGHRAINRLVERISEKEEREAEK